MELNLLLRGQSNAYYLTQSPNWGQIAGDVEKLLGFDGVTNVVNVLSAHDDPFGNNTINGGTAFIGDWVTPNGGNYQNGWSDNTLESGILSYINNLSSTVKASPTAVVWLHNEYDSTNPTLTTAEWASAVEFDAAQVRAALGQSTATVPYVFVNAIPYGSGSIDSVNQAIKLGMEELSSSAPFHATIGAQFDDVSMDYGQTGYYGGPHMDGADGNQLILRLAASVAQSFAQYALPGSPVATGQLDAYGPEVMAARNIGGNHILVTVANDHGTLNPSLNGEAAGGLGWSIIDNGSTFNASSAQVVGTDQVLLGFSGAVPADSTASLFYAYGYGRLATGSSDPGHGNAIYDNQQMPIWTPATGVSIAEGAGQGAFVEQNMTTGATAFLQGSASAAPAFQSEFTTVSADSVAVTAVTPNAFMNAGFAVDALVATSGNNLLNASQDQVAMIGGGGTDTFVADASGAPIYDVIANFHVGEAFVLWGQLTSVAPAISWTQESNGALLTVAGSGFGTANVLFQSYTVAQAQGDFVHGMGSVNGFTAIEFLHAGALVA